MAEAVTSKTGHGDAASSTTEVLSIRRLSVGQEKLALATALLLVNTFAGYRWSTSTEAWTAAK